MKMETFQKQLILALLAYAAKRDIDPVLVCRHSGIDEKVLGTNSKIEITPHQIEGIWKNLLHISNDPLIGLHFGESMQLAALSVVGQIIETSRTIGEALTVAGNLSRLVTNMFTMRIEHRQETFMIYLIADEKKKNVFPVTFRQMADYLMVFIIHELDGLLLKRIAPLKVSFSYPVSNPDEYARVMRRKVDRAHQQLAIEFERIYLDEPIISANYDLHQQLLDKIRYLLPDSSEANTYRSRIFNYLLTNSYLYDISLQSIAANFNVSARTLQRKLQDEGVSFVQIVEDVKRNLAILYLSSGKCNVKDVAHLLGYKEQSALNRAFKRWTGKTPTEYLNTSRVA